MLRRGGPARVWRRRGAVVVTIAFALAGLNPRPAEAAATLTLSPVRGPGGVVFTATYRLQVVECFSAGQSVSFFWDSLPRPVAVGTLDATCTASMSIRPPSNATLGRHNVRGRWCSMTCQNASAIYEIIAAPPPTTTTTTTAPPTTTTRPPTATTRPPTATTTAATTTTSPPSTTTSSTSSTTSTTTTSIAPTTTVVPPTTVAVAAPADVPPPDDGAPPPDVAVFVAATPGPGDVAATGAVVVTNVLLTLLLLLFFGTTSSVFNNTVDANRLVFEGWGRRLRHRLRRLLPIENEWRLSPRLRVVLILSLTAVVYGFLSPGFGFDRASLSLLLALVAGIGVLTYVSEGGAVWFSGHRLGVPAGLRVHGGALLAAILCVLVSRALGFQPGIVYGFIASAVVLGSFALDRRQAGEFAFYPAAAVLGIGVGAWLALGWVRGGGVGGEAGGLLESGLAVLAVGGIEGVMFSMVPLAFMDGRAVIEWSRRAWAALAGLATFLFWQLLVNPNLAYLDAFRESGVKLVFSVAVGFAAVTAATWLYFRMRAAGGEPAG